MAEESGLDSGTRSVRGNGSRFDAQSSKTSDSRTALPKPPMCDGVRMAITMSWSFAGARRAKRPARTRAKTRGPELAPTNRTRETSLTRTPVRPARSTSTNRRTGLAAAQLRDAAPSRLPWMTLLARVFRVDISVCSRCCGPMRVTRAVTTPQEIAAELRGARPPPRAPPVGQLLLFSPSPAVH